MFGFFEAQILNVRSERALMEKTPIIVVSVISALIKNCIVILPLLMGSQQKLSLILSLTEDIR